MTVRELIAMLQEIEDQGALVCVPDFSSCHCGARDGEYSAESLTVKRSHPLPARVVIE